MGVLGWRRAKMGLWGGCQGSLRPWEGGRVGAVRVRVCEPAGGAHKTGRGRGSVCRGVVLLLELSGSRGKQRAGGLDMSLKPRARCG